MGVVVVLVTTAQYKGRHVCHSLGNDSIWEAGWSFERDRSCYIYTVIHTIQHIIILVVVTYVLTKENLF